MMSDPLEGASFEAIYDQKIKPELVKREVERKAALQTFVVVLLGGVVMVFLESKLAAAFIRGPSGAPNLAVAAVTMAAAGFFGYLPLRRVARQAKLGMIQALCQPLGVDYALSGDAPALETFLALKLLPRPEDKSFEDFFCGRRGEVDFTLCEATLTEGEGKERRTVFQGQLIRLTRPRRLASTTVVLRNTGWLNRFECPHGLAAVGLEDPRFTHLFAAFGSDQVEAREILTPVFMQRLVDLEQAYGGASLRCAFTGPELLIAVEGARRFEIGGMFANLVNKARVEGIARDLEQVFKVIDAFKDA